MFTPRAKLVAALFSDPYAGRREGLAPPAPPAFLRFRFPPPARPLLGAGPRTYREINYARPSSAECRLTQAEAARLHRDPLRVFKL